jgi:hypothetical protein
VEVEVGASASAEVGGGVVAVVRVGVVAEVGGEVGAVVLAVVGEVVGVGGDEADVGDKIDVGVRVDVGLAALVRGGRVGGVPVAPGNSVTLVAGRLPEGSVEGRAAGGLPSPAPQPLSKRTRPITSPARKDARPARRSMPKLVKLVFLASVGVANARFRRGRMVIERGCGGRGYVSIRGPERR